MTNQATRLSLILSVCISIGATTSAIAQWTTAVNLTGDVQRYESDPFLAIDSTGKMHTVYQNFLDSDGRVYYKYNDGSGWSARELVDLTNGKGSRPCVVVDPNDTLHVFYGKNDLYWRYRPASGGTWSSPVLLNPRGGGFINDVAVDASGGIYFMYGHLFDDSAPVRNGIYGRYKPAGGGWGPVEVIRGNSDDGNWPLGEDVFTNGNEIWISISWDDRIWYKKRNADGSWPGGSSGYGTFLHYGGALRFAKDPASNEIAAAYHEAIEDTAESRWFEVFVMYSYDNGVTWTAPENLSNMIGLDRIPQLTYDALGNLHYAWEGAGCADCPLKIRVRSRTDGVWGDMYQLSPYDWSSGLNSPGAMANYGDQVHIVFGVGTETSSWWDVYYSQLEELEYPPQFHSASVSEPTLTADGSTEYQVTLEVSDGDGGVDIRDMRVMLNRDFSNYDTCRGYLIWGLTENDVNRYQTFPNVTPATGGGYWAFDHDQYGYQYIEPVDCSTSVNGEVRTVNWTIKVNPIWAQDGPETGNFIGMTARDDNQAIGWSDSTDVFNYTFNIQPNPLPDFDQDTDVDQADFAALQRCFSGSGQPTETGCEFADLDGDGDGDIYDVAIFNLCGTAPGIPGDPACRDLTVEGMLPDKAHSPSPADGATGVMLPATLAWSAGTAATSHDVYFGTTSSPTLQGNQTSTSFDPGSLSLNTTYFWRIDEVNVQGTTTGDTWSFTTTNVLAENLNRYQFANLSVGSEYYLDRTYTIIFMPPALNGQLGIKTNNDDKTITSSNWITFDLNAPATVYVIYDGRGMPVNGGTLPSWLDSFTNTGMTVEVSDGGASPMGVLSKSYDPGPVVLGGNMQPPASGADANYFVVIVPE
jgi:hypothetical protein